MRSGIVSNASEIGSTVGKRAAITTQSAMPMRRFLRRVPDVITPSRTSASMKIGSWKMSDMASSAKVTNER